MIKVKNNRQIIVGIFILFGIAILIIAIFTLGGQKKTFVKSFTIHAVFNDVGGLIKGSNIWFSGVKVGTVKHVSFYGNSQVQVDMNVEDNVQSHIHKNSKARIGSDGLIGNKIVIIYDSDSSMPQIEKNDFLTVEKALNTDDMLATLQANNLNVLEITKRFKSISKKIDSGNGVLAALLNDATITNGLKNTVENLQVTAANFKTVSLSSKIMMHDLQIFSDKLNKPGNSINSLITDTLLYENIKRSVAQIEKAVNAAKVFAENLQTASQSLHQKGNAAGMLLNDSATATSIKITLKNLETSSQKLDADLEAIQHNFLLRGFFRKKEKTNQQ